MSQHTNTPAEWNAYADEQQAQAMRYVSYATHPATSEHGRADAEERALEYAIRAGAYRAGGRQEFRRLDRWIGALYAA